MRQLSALRSVRADQRGVGLPPDADAFAVAIGQAYVGPEAGDEDQFVVAPQQGRRARSKSAMPASWYSRFSVLDGRPA